MKFVKLALLKAILAENLDAIPFPKDQASDHEFPPRLQRSPNMPFGHLRPLGTQRRAEGMINEFDAKLTNSYTLYEAAKKGPCVAKDFFPVDSSASLWDDVELEEFGETLVEVTQKLAGGKQKSSMKKLSELIGLYHGHSVHVDTTLPAEMEAGLKLPKAIMCGPYKTNVVDKRMWRSSGKVAEPLRRSQFDQMFCTLHGRSDWIVYDKRDLRHLGSSNRQPDGSYEYDIDIDLVNIYNVPGLKQSRWRWATTANRNCIFVPANQAYQVRHYGTTNMISMKWRPFEVLGKTVTFPVAECDNADTNSGSTQAIWMMEHGQVKINEAFLNDWSTLRDLLFAYADSDYALKKETWDWIVKKADNTYGDPNVTWNYFTGFDDAATGSNPYAELLTRNKLAAIDVNVTEIVQESLKVAITYQLTNPDQEKHRLRDEL